MLNVNTINAKNSQKFEVKPGQPTSIKVEPNTRFELADPTTGKAPVQIKARRAGDNLEIVTDEKALIEEEVASNAQSPDLVLENYYKQEDVSLFAGTGEAAVSYVPVDGAAAGSYAAMSTSATTGAALGVLPLLNPWVGAAVLGTGALAASGSGKSNQAPVAQDAAAKVDENKLLSDKVPAATDTDGTVASYRLVSDVAAGKLTFNTDGSYSFDANKDFDGLAAGQTRTVSFTYSAVDNAGGVSDAKTVSITVTGTNDVPVAIAVNKSINEGVAAAGSVTASDADSGAKLTYALTETAPAGLTFYKDGTYIFDAKNVAYDSLKAGELKTIAVKFKANDGTVDSAEQTLTIKVVGTNDAPVASFVAAQTATEGGSVVLGQLTSSDIDKDATAAYAADGPAIAGLTITAKGGWSFDPTNAAYQSLAADESRDVTVTYKVTDDQGGSDTESFKIMVIGTNDAPVATFVAAQMAIEDGSTISGQLTSTDADVLGKTVTYALEGPAIAGLAINANGSWSFDPTNSAYQSLAAGQKQEISVTYKVTDDKGASDTESFKITVTGMNDTAIITGQDSGTVTEDDALTTTGRLDLSDLDNAEKVFRVPASLKGEYGSFTLNAQNGDWTYSLDNQAIQTLRAGYFLEDKLTITSVDGTASKTILIKILGADDRALITLVGNDQAVVVKTESVDHAAPTASGTFTVSTLDYGDKVVISGVKFNAEKSDSLTNTTLTAEKIEAGFLNSLVLEDIKNNGADNNLKWNFYTDGTLPKDFHLVLDYTLQSINANGNVTGDVVSGQTLQVDVTGVNSPVMVSLQGNDKDILSVTENNAVITSAINTLTVNEWDYGDDVYVEIGSAKVNFQKSDFLASSNVTAEDEQYIKQWLDIGEFRNLGLMNNLDWNFKTLNANDLDLVPEGKTLVLDYVLNFYENNGPEPVTTKTIEVIIVGKNDAPFYKDNIGGDSSSAQLNISASHFAKAEGTLTPYDPDFVETITHEIKGVSFDAVHSTVGMKSKFDALNSSLKNLLTFEALPTFSDPHSLIWKFNASEVDLSKSFADVQTGSVLAMDYVLRVSDVLGAFSEQKIHIELNV